jgi:hypothetical protein
MNIKMTTYRNDKFGFEIDLPEGWAITTGMSRIPVILSNVINQANILEEFGNSNNERINIVVDQMRPEIPPDINKYIFLLHAQDMNYTEVQFGDITIQGRDHATACYVMNLKGWLKKYLIVLNGYGYAITASCPIGQRSSLVEETWDKIAESIRLLNPIDDSVILYNNSPEAHSSIEFLRSHLEMQLINRKHQKS